MSGLRPTDSCDPTPSIAKTAGAPDAGATGPVPPAAKPITTAATPGPAVHNDTDTARTRAHPAAANAQTFPPQHVRQADAIRSDRAVAMGREAYAESHGDGHWLNESARHWEGVRKDNDRAVDEGRRGPLAATIVDLGAQTMGFFVNMSGLRQVRDRSAQLGAEWGGGASGYEKAKTISLLTGEVALAAANGLGVGGVARATQVSREGAAIVQAAKAAQTTKAATVVTRGAAGAIAGMRSVGRPAAAQVAKELQAVIKELPLTAGGKVTAEQAKVFLSRLRDVAARYGVSVREGGVAGEAVGQSREVVVSLAAGAPHEMVHALQMVQTRATAFLDEAVRLGTTVADMPASGFERAHTTTVRPFEHQAYAAFEAMAFQSTGFMGQATANAYRSALKTGIEAFREALAQGAVPRLGEGLGARLYGELTILGRSQAEIAEKLAIGTGAVIGKELRN
ncbi:MAG: hypothetical protein H7338_21845 [Candidatus Sericytochromatia bacterium]|nr:hypothetical protein [Candidatus Sericytochromatia bacterium]